jgi:hypothetical protein
MEFSADGGLLAVECGDASRKGVRRTHVFDTKSGDVVLVGPPRLQIVESGAGPVLAVTDNSELRVWNAVGGELWKRPTEAKRVVCIGPAVLCHLAASHHVEVLELGTGHVIASVPFESKSGVSATLTSDGQRALLRGGPRFDPLFLRGPPAPAWKQWVNRWLPWFLPPPKDWGVAVVETTTGRELFRMKHGEEYEFQLSEDGTTLVGTLRRDPRTAPVPGPAPAVIRVWDVHPGQAWRWAITSGVIVAAGLMLLGYSRQVVFGRETRRLPLHAASYPAIPRSTK